MSKTKIKNIAGRATYVFAAIAILFAYFPLSASAGQITPRKVALGSSIASANTSYAFTFTTISSSIIKSVKFQICDTPSGSCVNSGSSSGFSSTTPGSTLAVQPTTLGTGTWSVSNTAQYELRLANDGTNTTAGPISNAAVTFNNVHNPSATNSTFFIRITTYSDVAWTNALDTGSVATSTAGLVTVNALVDETLTFTLGTTTVTLGGGSSMTTGAASTGTSTMTAATNAASGYSISYTGNTLTGPVAITAMSSATTSNPGSKQFGLNLMANTGGRGGVSVSGSGSGVPWTTADYGTVDTFKFASGDIVAHATAPTNPNTFTVDYLANIDAATPAGAYTTTITYVATANF